MNSARSTIVRSVSLDADLAVWAEEKATSENRSVSNYINTLLGRIRDREVKPTTPPQVPQPTP